MCLYESPSRAYYMLSRLEYYSHCRTSLQHWKKTFAKKTWPPLSTEIGFCNEPHYIPPKIVGKQGITACMSIYCTAKEVILLHGFCLKYNPHQMSSLQDFAGPWLWFRHSESLRSVLPSPSCSIGGSKGNQNTSCWLAGLKGSAENLIKGWLGTLHNILSLLLFKDAKHYIICVSAITSMHFMSDCSLTGSVNIFLAEAVSGLLTRSFTLVIRNSYACEGKKIIR